MALLTCTASLAASRAGHSKLENNAVIGIVEKITGTCFIQRARKDKQAPLAIGFRLFENDTVLADKGKIHVRYKDRTYAELAEESALQIERLRLQYDQKDETVLRFLYGVIRFVVPKKQETLFTVKTANVVVQVLEDSEFYILQPKEIRDLTVGVFRGKVRIMSEVTNNAMEISAGNAAYLKISGLASSVGTFRSDQIEFLKSRTRM